MISIIPPFLYDTGSLDPSSCRTMAYQLYIINIMVADEMAQ